MQDAGPEDTMPELSILVAAAAIIVILGLVWVVRRAARPTDAVLSYSPSGYASTDFRLTIQDTFLIKGRGLVVTGKVESSSLEVGQKVQITSPDGLEHYETQVVGVEAFHQQQTTAQAGQNVGLLLKGLTREQIKPGMLVTL